MKCENFLCLSLCFVFAAVVFANTPAPAPLQKDWKASLRGVEQETAYLRQLVADAKAKGVAPDAAWIARLSEGTSHIPLVPQSRFVRQRGRQTPFPEPSL